MQIYEHSKFGPLEEIRIFGLPIIKSIYKKMPYGYEKNLEILSESFEEFVLNSIIKSVPEEYDFIWFIRPGRLGEAYLLNFMIDEIHQKYKVKNPCIVSHKIFHKYLYELYLDIPFYHINLDWTYVNIALRNRNYFYKGRRIKIFHSTYKESMELHNNKFALNTGDTYPNEIKKLTGATHFANKYQKFNKEITDSVEKKLSNFYLDNFVIFIPDANSMLTVSKNFWRNLLYKLKTKGLNIYTNSLNGYSDIGESALLNIAEFSYLASRSKGIISSRCGLSEIISTHNIPKHIIYTPHKCNPITANEMLRNSSLKNYPMVDPKTVFEYSTDELSEDEIINEIMKGF